MIDQKQARLLKNELEKNQVDFAHIDIIEETGHRLYEITYENQQLKIVQNPTSGYYIPKSKINQPSNIHRLPITLHGTTGILEVYYSKSMLLF
ncbi:MAG TPA: hypothetical protein VJ824_04905, partial [Bacillota bacterium]|nr:hypothetical protein [Bacillota bacterium]